jgi:fucose 4-O-acetylase-like acetyltransferase
MTAIGQSLTQALEPIAAPLRTIGIPDFVVHWGHPLMMGIVVLVMGSAAAWAGWQARLSKDADVAQAQRQNHRKVAPLMFLFIALGYTGGVLSLVMQNQPILESPHFWTGTVALGVLSLNSMFSLSGFWGDRSVLRASHAYLGTAALVLLLIHGAFGIKLGLSL